MLQLQSIGQSLVKYRMMYKPQLPSYSVIQSLQYEFKILVFIPTEYNMKNKLHSSKILPNQ